MSNRRQNPSPAEKNKWLEGTSCFCLSVLPVSPGRGFMARTVCVCVWGESSWKGGWESGVWKWERWRMWKRKWTQRELKAIKKIKCSQGMIRTQKEIERNRHYQREERPKCQRIKVTNTPPVTLQLLSLIGGLGDWNLGQSSWGLSV